MRERRRPLWNLLLAVLTVLAASYLLYLAVANTVLMTSIGQRLVSSERVRVSWSRGWSLVPRSAHLRGLAVDVSGRRAGWRIEAARADARVALLPLLARKVHLLVADVDDVTLAPGTARQAAEERVSTSASRLDGLIEVAYARAVGVERTGTGDQASTERSRGGCTHDRASVEIDRLTATRIRMVRVGQSTVRGSAKLEGAVAGCPSGSAVVEGVSLAVSSAELLRRERHLLGGIRANATVDHARLDPDAPWRTFIGSANDVALDVTAGGADGPGELDAKVRVEDGVVAPGSKLFARVHPSVATALSGELIFDVAENGGARATLHAKQARGLAARGDASGLAVQQLDAELRTPKLALDAPFRATTGTVDAKGLAFDLAIVPPLRAMVGGHAPMRGDAHLEVAGGALSGTLEARDEPAERTTGASGLDGELRLHVNLHDHRLGSDEARFRATARYDYGDGERATVRLEDALLRLADSPALDSALEIETSNAASAFQAFVGTRLPPLVTTVARAAPLRAEGTLDARPDAFTVRDLHGTVGVVTFEGRLSRPAADGAHATAAFLFEAGPLSAGLSVASGEATFILADARRWFAEETARPRAPER